MFSFFFKSPSGIVACGGHRQNHPWPKDGRTRYDYVYTPNKVNRIDLLYHCIAYLNIYKRSAIVCIWCESHVIRRPLNNAPLFYFFRGYTGKCWLKFTEVFCSSLISLINCLTNSGLRVLIQFWIGGGTALDELMNQFKVFNFLFGSVG